MESQVDKIKREKQREQELQGAITNLKDFLEKQLPPNKWVADNLIPEGMTILSSAPGQYKTYMLLALAKQISKGDKAFNHFYTEKRNVLFINEEMGENSMQSRLKTISGEYGDVYLTNLAGVKLDDINVILKLCKEKNITLVMFDSLTRIHSLKENDADDVKKIFEAMLGLLRANISIIMTHHHRKTPMFGAKNGSEEMRGSIDILAQIDCHLAIDQVAVDKSYVILKQLKIRIAENMPDFKVEIKKDCDNKLSFVYSGSFSKGDETKIKVAMNRDAILKIVLDNPGLTKDDIIAKAGGTVGQVAIKATLLDLEKTDVIYSKTQRPKTYYIKEEITTLF